MIGKYKFNEILIMYTGINMRVTKVHEILN